MISDLLHDAAADIRYYQRQFPDYKSISKELSVLLILMDAIRQSLDTPPVPYLVGSAEALLSAVRQVDVAGVVAAQRQFQATCESIKAASPTAQGEG